MGGGRESKGEGRLDVGPGGRWRPPYFTVAVYSQGIQCVQHPSTPLTAPARVCFNTAAGSYGRVDRCVRLHGWLDRFDP